MTDKEKRLIDYCQGILKNEDGGKLYKTYLEDIKTITAEEVIKIENEQLKMGYSAKELLRGVDKLMNVFYESLKTYELNDLPLFLQIMIEENNALEKILDDFKKHMKSLEQMDKKVLRNFLSELLEYNLHMEKIENIIFSYLEKVAPHFQGLKIMWSLHDDVRRLLKELLEESQKKEAFTLKADLGQLYFMMYGLVQKQNLVLYPVCLQRLTTDDFDKMHIDSYDYGFSYITPPQVKQRKGNVNMNQIGKLIETSTGKLELETLIAILNVLPIDFTFVDENDEVAFFNDAKDRIFPRSSSIIGRNVRNCHPPESVHVVEDILKAFKAKEKDKAEFWIMMRGMMIYIYYLPIFDGESYKGTLEISQEISQLRALEGEQRLLDWSK